MLDSSGLQSHIYYFFRIKMEIKKKKNKTNDEINDKKQ
jgi:hypothetical protein